MSLALINGRVLTDNGFQTGFAVLVDNERITGLALPSDPRVRAAERHDLGGRTLLPGFIDAQVNGGGGVLFNDEPTVDAIRRIGEAHAKYGTTGFLPTLISDDATVMAKAIDAVNDAVAQGVPGVLGIHLEGPFIAPARKGVHDPAKFRVAGADDIAMIARRLGGVTLLTLAPERADEAVLRQLVENGVLVCAGHTAADYETTRKALSLGVRGFTHLFNAMTPFTSREPGVVGAALDDHASWCGLIVDGHHVHPASLRVAIAAKAPRKMMLVTDAMPPVGSDNPDFVLKGETITMRDGVCQTADGTLAGSALDMASAVRNTVQMVGVGYDEAARMASSYVAEFLRLGDTHGHIAAGYQADFVVMDEAMQVAETWIAGKRVYTAQ